MISEKAAWYSVMTILVMVMLLGAYKMTTDANCRELAVAQNYPADAVKRICR